MTKVRPRRRTCLDAHTLPDSPYRTPPDPPYRIRPDLPDPPYRTRLSAAAMSRK